MAVLQKNIWMIFYVLLVSALFFLGYVSYAKWDNIHDKYAANQTNQVKLVSNAMHALLLSQETSLNILGHQLIKEQNAQLLDALLALNPSVVAYGFTDPEGTYLHVNSHFDKTKLPNLRQNPLTQDSFDYTLTQDKMVLGRTYFISGGGRWGIPIRKAVFNGNDNALGVMTAGLGIEGAFKLFAEELALGEHNEVMFLRDRDGFVQYYSSVQATPKEMYDAPVSEAFLEGITEEIMRTYGVSLKSIKTDRHIYLVEALGPEGILEQIAIKYDPRYELWVISRIDHGQLVKEFFESFFVFLFVFLVVHSVLFVFFKIIATAEKQRRNDLIYQATHDELTALPNRSYLKQEIRHWIYEGAPPFSLYYLDMDHFKDINDSFGHYYGDVLLVEFSKRILRMVRKDSVVVRQGGDEFIILTRRTNPQEIVEHAESILRENALAYHVDELSFIIGASVGIAKYPEHGTTLDALLRASDIAMHEAKKYKNSVRLFSPSMQESYLGRISIEQALRKSLDNHEFFMVYQPQFDASGHLYGVEALVRWEHPKLGLVPPGEFIPIAEAAGIMPRLGQFILSTTLGEMKRLQDELGISFQISINISVRQFMEKDFLEQLARETSRHQLEHVSLCLEITESLFIEDMEYVLPLLHKVRDMGLGISMDDFGTGYSSLNMLRTLPIDELKIDKSFIDTLLDDVTAQKMIQNIITIGKNLELYVLAEGVETSEQERLLKSFG
ncbi:MAG: EAL domain-containing protein, partial [Campylobacterales bacterium]|nr:EAL domain-containing protein [Campylobacterales bacterium]